MGNRKQSGAVGRGRFESFAGQQAAPVETVENFVLDAGVGFRLFSLEKPVVALERACLQHPQTIQLLVENRRREVVVDRRVVRLGLESSLVGGDRLVVFEIEIVVVARGAMVRSSSNREKNKTRRRSPHSECSDAVQRTAITSLRLSRLKKNWAILKSPNSASRLRLVKVVGIVRWQRTVASKLSGDSIA